MKVKPFLPRIWSSIFIFTVLLSFPYWVVEIYASKSSIIVLMHDVCLLTSADFAYFHGINAIFKQTRPLELLFRDPWWIITTVYLFVIIKTQYEMTLKEIIRISPRFGIMLGAMIISIIFIIFDVLSVTGALKLAGDTGINPFWKIAFVFKCLTDSVILDDFKMALDRLRAFKISRLGSFSGDLSDRRTRNDGNLVETWEKAERDAQRHNPQPSPKSSPERGFEQPNKFPDYQATFQPKEHKDSVIAPDQYTARSSRWILDPDDIVPSAIEDPPANTQSAGSHLEKRRSEWSDDVDIDYAQALREVEGQSPPSSPSKSYFPRRSRQP